MRLVFFMVCATLQQCESTQLDAQCQYAFPCSERYNDIVARCQPVLALDIGKWIVQSCLDCLSVLQNKIACTYSCGKLMGVENDCWKSKYSNCTCRDVTLASIDQKTFTLTSESIHIFLSGRGYKSFNFAVLNFHVILWRVKICLTPIFLTFLAFDADR